MGPYPPVETDVVFRPVFEVVEREGGVAQGAASPVKALRNTTCARRQSR
jgi:hypothetical protein